ncbi:DegV family protein [bacterium]|jgi:DegV family protein with EDD domain|nr:DegV family protein [bacterium]
MKKATIIIGDSASIREEDIKKYGFVVVPFVMEWPEGKGLKGENIFEKMREAEKQGIITTPKTSQPSIGLFKKAFEEGLKDSESILTITISSGISGTYNSAIQAKKMFDEETQKKIFILDTLNADLSESLLAIRGAELLERGKTIEETFKDLEAMLPKIFLFAMLESPKWLEAGGRLSHSVAVILAQMQKIGMRPILAIKDGVIKPANLKMQAKDTAEALFKQFEETTKKPLSENKLCRVAISHADNLEGAQRLRTLIEDKYPQIKVEFISITSMVIGCHVGPGTVMCCSIEN